MQLRSRPATDADIPFLMRLRQQAMNGHLEASGASTGEAEHRVRLHRFDCAQVLLDRDDPVGLLKVSKEGQDWSVIQIQLVPRLQGRGIGAELLQAVIADALAARASLTLHVLKANPAKSLYARLGFVIDGESEHEYSMRYQPSRY